jgi:hypothetical protein
MPSGRQVPRRRGQSEGRCGSGGSVGGGIGVSWDWPWYDANEVSWTASAIVEALGGGWQRRWSWMGSCCASWRFSNWRCADDFVDKVCQNMRFFSWILPDLPCFHGFSMSFSSILFARPDHLMIYTNWKFNPL